MRVDRRRPGKPQAGRGPGNFKLNRDFMATKALLGALPACVRVL